MWDLLAEQLAKLLARVLWLVVGPITQQIFAVYLPIDAAMELM